MRAIEESNKALYENIQLLSGLLVRTLKKQVGSDILEILEEILNNAKIDKQKDIIKKINKLIKNLPNEKILAITRALSHFLNLTEIAEQYHRVRRSRSYQHAENALQPGSVEFSLSEFIRKGVSPESLYQAVCDLNIELVLTAHPTEATRRTLIHKYYRIAVGLAELDRLDLTPKETKGIIDSLQIEIESAWLTNEIRINKPTAVEEAKWGFAVVEQSLWAALPQMMRDFDKILYSTTGKNLPIDKIPIRFSSWMGGDRDGNPNVTTSVTKEVVYLARWKAADLYLQELTVLQDALSMNDCSPELSAIAGDSEMPYRVILRKVRSRLNKTKEWAEHQGEGEKELIYLDSEDLLDPLMLCYNSLLKLGADLIANGQLLDLIRRVRCFGLSLLPLDIRQDASKHTDLMDEMTKGFPDGSYREWSEEKRQAYLIEQLSDSNLDRHTNAPTVWIPHDLVFSPEAQEQLDTFRLIATLPRDSLNTYIISMASKPSDVLLVFFLQKALGITQPLRIVPLFETLVDLNNAVSCIDALLSIDVYKASCNGLQEILIGYSDSAKDAGFLAASWAQYQAQEALMAVGQRHDIKIVFFHGRGGSTGRGGGPTHLAIRSQPPGSVQGRLRITQQGEVIRHRFSMQKIAERTLGIYATATLEAMLLPEPIPPKDYRDLMDKLSQVSLNTYQHVIKDNAKFIDYFYAVTPIHELDKLAIASRPTRRKIGRSIENLRAIPWVFAWTQNRLLLPAWLGVGEALEIIVAEKKVAIAKNWLFFSSLLNMIEMVLAKAAPYITQQYEERLVSHDLWDIGNKFRSEFLKTENCLLKILGEKKLLSTNAILERSIQVRNPYLFSLHLLQIELLDRYRHYKSADQIDKQVERALLVSIEGIAAGMHNTG